MSGTLVDGMKEAESFEQFMSWYMQFKIWFDIEPQLIFTSDKVIVALPVGTDFNRFWLKPTQLEQFFIYRKNIFPLVKDDKK